MTRHLNSQVTIQIYQTIIIKQTQGRHHLYHQNQSRKNTTQQLTKLVLNLLTFKIKFTQQQINKPGRHKRQNPKQKPTIKIMKPVYITRKQPIRKH